MLGVWTFEFGSTTALYQAELTCKYTLSGRICFIKHCKNAARRIYCLLKYHG